MFPSFPGEQHLGKTVSDRAIDGYGLFCPTWTISLSSGSGSTIKTFFVGTSAGFSLIGSGDGLL
jgi:hypothetical protein